MSEITAAQAAAIAAGGGLPTPSAPAAGLLTIVGIGNGETLYSNKSLLDTTNPAALASAAAPGSSLTAARRDHVHALPALDAVAAPTDIVTLNATTSSHGLLIKATAPSSGLRNIVAIDNGETVYKNTALFDTTNPAALGTAAPGTSLIAARRDHIHALPAIDATGAASDNTTRDATTSAHGLLLKATAPASGLRNIVAIDNAETSYKNTALLDNTTPAVVAGATTATSGTAMTAARRDHVHALDILNMPLEPMGTGLGVDYDAMLPSYSGAGWNTNKRIKARQLFAQVMPIAEFTPMATTAPYGWTITGTPTMAGSYTNGPALNLTGGGATCGIAVTRTDFFACNSGVRYMARVACQAGFSDITGGTWRIGFMAANTPAADVDGHYWRYDSAVNSGKLQCVTRVGGVETVTDSGITVSIGQLLVLLIEETNNGSDTKFYWETGAGAAAVETLVATHTTNRGVVSAQFGFVVGQSGGQTELSVAHISVFAGSNAFR